MMKASVVVAAIAAVALGTPALAKTDKTGKHHPHVARAAGPPADWSAAPVDTSGAPHFIRVGPNGYWVTTSWGCWVDEGQGRIQDCNSGGGAAGR